ncbi:MAG: helix-turn-helix transcriptional regulator [Solirubrobacterales bacterium]|jgi:ArsR family transcriptional regulator|nr:helix-turn-helix transcriptional regulator [Solirubrobacterales bacterium]
MAAPSEHRPPARPLSAREAEQLAETVRAFSSASRLKLLWGLMSGPQTVERLAHIAGMTQSATSHQLRLLRQLHLVEVRREGRHAHYTLHDHHLPELLAALRHHHEHLGSAAAEGAPAVAEEG